MISAKEARDIANVGLVALDAKVEEVGKDIEYAAASGFFEVRVYLTDSELNYVGRHLGRMGYQYCLTEFDRTGRPLFDRENNNTTRVVVMWHEGGDALHANS